MGTAHQFKETGVNWPDMDDSSPEPLDVLTELVRTAQERGGHLEPVEVLKLAAAAKEAVESLLSDMEQSDREALQEAEFEALLVKGNA